jgi:hypothetical protein
MSATNLDVTGAFALYAAIARRALLDAANLNAPSKHREEAEAFLTTHFPEWRRWWQPRHPRQKECRKA